MQDELDLVLHDFLLESQENLARVEQEFVRLEQEPGNPELLGDIFRAIHSIKGSAGFLRLARLEEVAHAAEEVLGQIRAGHLAFNEPIMNCLLQAVDGIRSMLVMLERTGQEGQHDTQQVITALQRISEGKDCEQKDLTPQPPLLKGEGEQNLTPQASASEAPLILKGEGEQDLPSPLRRGAGGEVSSPEVADPLERALSSVEDTRMHVDISVLDRLMNLTGELVLSRNQVVRQATDSGQTAWLNVAQRLNGIVSELQENMLKTRMQELQKVFSLFPRLVRDVSKQHGKDVTLNMEGHHTELDRSLIEGLKMPLMHLVRNAIDHGIEIPAMRRQQGKSPTGTITITAYHDSGQVNIEIADDGAGIDVEQVRRKAVEQGILTQQDAELAGLERLLELIFRPGFSTAETVTDLSGRGVGMDVVKRHLNRLGGTIEIATKRGQGTTFTIRIPMTLAIIPGLLVMADERHFVIPQRNLEELVRLDDEERQAIKRVSGTEVYRLRGELLPLIRLSRVLEVQEKRDSMAADNDAPSDEESIIRSPHIVVLSIGDRRFGVVVDHVADTEEIVVKPLGRHIKEVACYDGATILGDGNVALILNARGLFSAGRFRLEEIQRAEQKETEQQQQAGLASTKEHQQTIVLFKAGHEEFYGVPLAFVERIETFPAVQIETSGGREVMQYRGDVLPLMRLEPLLELAPSEARDTLSLLVFSVEKDVGLVVQEVINTIDISTQIDTKSFQQKGVLGTTIVQGHSVLILDIHGLIELAYPYWYQQFFVSKLKEEERQKIRVLLAEDSKFFLNIEKSYLESAGYQVVTAENGNAAQERLAEQPFDVVVTDIDMPYCNGYELTRAIRSNAEWKHLPIMAVTALSGDEDRQKGVEAGVDEYRVKLDRDDVLNALEQLILRKQKK